MRINTGIFRIKKSQVHAIMRIPASYRLRDLPVYLAFYWVPFVSAVCIIIGIPQPGYENLWSVMLLFLAYSGRRRFDAATYNAIRVLLLLIFLKYLLPLCWARNVSFKALTIDFKWIYYLLWALVWSNFAGPVDLNKLYRCGRNMASGYIMFIIIRTLMLGGYSRHCTYLFGECNYVCYLILIPFCLIDRMKGSRLDYAIFLLAVFLSDSRTGLATAAALTAYPFYKRSRHKINFWILGAVFAIIYVRILFIDRGYVSLRGVDRVIFLLQYLYCLSGFNVFDIFFGLYPGCSIPILSYVDGFAWHISTFEKMHGISGCYPFYFHSTYLRLLFVWGIPLVAYALHRIGRLFRRTQDISLKKFIILLLMESISLSTLSLTNVSIIFFLTGIALLRENKSQKPCIRRIQGQH